MVEPGAPGQIPKEKGKPKDAGVPRGQGKLPQQGIPAVHGRPKGEGRLPGSPGQLAKGAPGQVERGAPGTLLPDAPNPWAVGEGTPPPAAPAPGAGPERGDDGDR